MLSDRSVTAPRALLEKAKSHGSARVLLAGADTETALESARAAVEAGLAEPLLIGAPEKIAASAEAIGWDISGLKWIPADGDLEISNAAGEAVRDPGIDIVMKGHVHTDALMGALLRKENGLRIGKRLSHVFHMTLPDEDRALMITDGALNVAPDAKTLQAITENLVQLCGALAIERPRIALLSASEERLAQMPSSVAAGELADWAKSQRFPAEFSGPLAFDNAVSPSAARIKGLDADPVAGHADALVVPSIETGNGLFKMMVYFMGACAAGVVLGGRIPIVITSRADPPQARLASLALARIAQAG